MYVYNLNTPYYLRPHYNSNYMNRYGNGNASNNQNVSLYSPTGDPDQRWKFIDAGNGNIRIVSELNNAYGLNVWRGSSNYYNCDIHTISGNATDSLIKAHAIAPPNIQGTGIVCLKFQLVNYPNYYLTAVGNDVRWQTDHGTFANDQLWWFTQSQGGVSPGSETEVQMPVNLNQKYHTNSQWIKNYGCAVCCGVDIASWKHNTNYNITNFLNHYSENINGYSWTGPGNFSMSRIDAYNLNEAQTIVKIREYVAAGTPIACHAVGYNSREHWFVAYKVDSSGGNTWATSGIYVLDPYNSNTNDYNGRRVSIWDAMSSSLVTLGIDSFRVPN